MHGVDVIQHVSPRLIACLRMRAVPTKSVGRSDRQKTRYCENQPPHWTLPPHPSFAADRLKTTLEAVAGTVCGLPALRVVFSSRATSGLTLRGFGNNWCLRCLRENCGTCISYG